MDLAEFLKSEAKEIEKIMQDHLLKLESWTGKNTPGLLVHAKAFIKISSGGKKIRGMLICLGYQLAKGQESKDIYDIAASYEIFHTSILTHDDIIDQSPLRRGQPSLYKVLGGGHYGISQAICLGDLGFFLATKIISQSNFPDQYKIKAWEHFSQTMIDTVLGEMLDVEGGDVTTIMRLKTAKYTVSAPLQLGAILAGADEELIKDLGEFGENLGIAFQIQDDILGVFGTEESLGKSVTSDIEEGKNTLLISYALKKANYKQKEILGEYYGQGSMGDKKGQGLEQIRQVFKETGAVDYAKRMAEEYVNKAKNIIPRLTKDQKMSTLLEQMAEYLVERSR